MPRIKPVTEKDLPDPLPKLSERELRILFWAKDSESPLSIAEFADLIESTCPGPRSAQRYARECVWRLESYGLMRSFGRAKYDELKFAISHLGLVYIDKITQGEP